MILLKLVLLYPSPIETPRQNAWLGFIIILYVIFVYLLELEGYDDVEGESFVVF